VVRECDGPDPGLEIDRLSSPTVAVGPFRVGRYRVDADDRWWGAEPRAYRGHPFLTFPCLPFEAEVVDDPALGEAGRGRFVYGSGEVVLTNPGSVGRGTRVHVAGSAGTWMSVAPDVLSRTLARIDPRLGDPARLPAKRISLRPGDLLYQRVLFQHLLSPSGCDPVDGTGALEELLELLLRTALTVVRQSRARGDRGGPGSRPAGRRPMTDHRHREMVTEVTRLLEWDPARAHRLPDLGHAVAASPLHLARVWKASTGETLHGRLVTIRLRRALDRLPGYRGRTTDLAMDLGFHDRSHLARHFVRTFGLSLTEAAEILADPAPGRLPGLRRWARPPRAGHALQ